MKSIKEILNKIKCPVVKERALDQFKPIGELINDDICNAIGSYTDWIFTNEKIKYWREIFYFIKENGNITYEQSLKFERYLPENYKGIKR